MGQVANGAKTAAEAAWELAWLLAHGEGLTVEQAAQIVAGCDDDARGETWESLPRPALSISPESGGAAGRWGRSRADL